MGINVISQGNSYNNADIPNTSPFSVSQLQSAVSQTSSFGDQMSFNDARMRLTNKSGYRTSGTYTNTRPSDLGSCRGQKYWGYRINLAAYYDYELSSSNIGVGVGLYEQSDNEIQFVFCSTDQPTTQSHFTSSSRTTVSNWTPVVNSNTFTSSPQLPSCYVYALEGPKTASTNPLYIYFNGTGTGFTLFILKLKLLHSSKDLGIHQWIITSTTAQQAAGSSTNPPANIIYSPFDQGLGLDYDWAWAAIYFASPQTTQATPTSTSYSFSPSTSTSGNYSLAGNSGVAPIGRFITWNHNSSGSRPQINDLHPNGQGSATFCDAGFYLGMR